MATFKLIFGKMSAQYESLLESGNLSDVVLVAGDKELHVHKLVLSTRSPVFSAMFAHSTNKEAQENRVEIIDVNVEVLELMVRYLYTGKVELLDRYASDLLVLADMYQVASLKLICEEQLLSAVITTESVSDLFLFADMYHAAELTRKCLDYITLNGPQVMATEGWKKIRVRPEWLEKIIAHSSVKYTKAIWNREFIDLNTVPFSMASFNLLIFEEMSDNYESLRKSCIRSDVILLVGEEELKVHRLVLSTRSPFFAAMFTNYHSTTKEIRLKVTNVDFEVLELWVRYIYTGKVDMLEQYAKELFVLAVEFRVDCLKFICKLELLLQICIESVCELLLLADFYQVTELYGQCLDYIATTNISQVMRQQLDDWMRIVLEPHLLTQVYQHLLINDSSELRLLSQISIEPVTLLFSADMFTVTKLSDECLQYIFDNITQVMVSEGWKQFLKGTDLLPHLYQHLHWKYLKLKTNVDLEKKKKASGIDLTIRSDSKFEKYLLKNSNLINYKEVISDVILVAGNKELKVHKRVLSAESPVFASMIRVKNRVQITDVDVKVLKLLLKYIYTGKVKLLDRNVVELIVAAEKYQLDSLKSKCEQQLLSNWRLMVIRTKTVSDLLIFADMHLVSELYLKCLDYIASHLTRVMASDGWKRIVLRVDLLTKICERLNLSLSEQLLLSPINSESVLNLLILAEEHQAMELVTKCVEYITDNVTQMMQQVEWEKIVARADLLAMLFEHLCSKYIRKYTQVLDKERCGRYMRYERKIMQEYMSSDDSDSDYEYGTASDFEYDNNFDSYYSYYEYDNDDSYYDFDYEYDN